MTPEEAEAQVKATQEALDAVNKPKSSPIPSIILGAVGLVLLIMGIAMKLPPLIYAAICPVLGGAGWLTFAYIQDKRDAAVRGEILSRCKAESSGELLSVASGYAVIYHEAQSADEAVAAAEAALKQAEAEAGPAAASLSAALSKLTDQSPDQETAQELITHLNRQLDEYSMVTFQLESTERIYASLTQDFNANMSAEADVPEMGLLVRPVRNKKETQELLSKTQAQLELASTKYSMAQGTINAMGDPVVLSAERNMLQEQYNTAKTEYDALALAIETLSDANSEIQTRFAPMLSGKASEIMARLTDGKYRKLGFSRTLESEAEPFGSTVSRSSLYLSQGTADQLYLALRLAICDLVLPDGAECPLILDDALVNFDDKRANNALELLRELSETRQVIILTCQSREAEYFSSDSDVSIIKLGDGN
jgi:DNA repair exonuclease SbcCD ATPase subunit